MKILLSAFACEPGQGSEEGVGWNAVVEAAKHQEVWVLTRTFYRAAIEAELALGQNPNLHFAYIEPFGWSENFKGRQGGLQLHYYLWQILAYLEAREPPRQINFDIARHVTYVKFWSPSFISLLPIPFIWGPVGGGEAAPKPFWLDFTFKANFYETARVWGHRFGEAGTGDGGKKRAGAFRGVSVKGRDGAAGRVQAAKAFPDQVHQYGAAAALERVSPRVAGLCPS